MSNGWEATITADIPVPSLATSYDLYQPESPWALIVYVHGGGWEAGDKDRPPGFRSLLAAGLAIASVTYRFSDAATIDGMVDDIRASSAAARARLASRGFPMVPWLVWGISAGAHLALLLAARTVNGEAPAGVCSWCGPTDLVALAALEGVKDHCRTDITRVIGKLVGAEPVAPQAVDPAAATLFGEPHAQSQLHAWSPITHVRAGLPPHLLIHGSDDGLVPPDHSRRMHARLLEAGVDSEYYEVPGGAHALPPAHWEGTDRMVVFFRRAVTGRYARVESSTVSASTAAKEHR